MSGQSRNLLRPGKIVQMALKNRVVVTEMETNPASKGGYCGEALMAYHKPQGGAGLIIGDCNGVRYIEGAIESVAGLARSI